MKLISTLLCALLLWASPSGRPPTGPLQRVEPRVTDVTMHVNVRTDRLNELTIERGVMDFADAAVVMPLVYQGTYSRIEPDSVFAGLLLGQNEIGDINERSRVVAGQPHHAHLAVIPIDRFRGLDFTWKLGFRITSWSSRVTDEQAMGQFRWPREWPADVLDGLEPQPFIESDDAIFAQAVQAASKGQLRFVPPYFAAKDLIRYCIENVQVTGSGERMEAAKQLRGMVIDGAAAAARQRRGSPHDLVCVCVATLKAAGIPARPVVGIYENEYGRTGFISWGEFFIAGAGWVPFDPNMMRGKGIQARSVHDPWGGLGTIKELHDRIPLAYGFVPADASLATTWPAVWGWDANAYGAPSVLEMIWFTTVSRGRGAEEPR